MTYLPFAAVSALLLVALSPTAAYRLAEAFEWLARELRHHGGATAGAYAAYSHIRRNLDARTKPSVQQEFGAEGTI